MAVNLKSLFDAGKQPLVVIDFQIRMNSSLHQDSGASERNGLFNLLMDHVVRQNIGFRIAFDAVKGAKCTELLTYICVIDVAIDYVTDDVIRMPAPANTVRTRRQIEQICLFEKKDGLFRTNPAALSSGRSEERRVGKGCRA